MFIDRYLCREQISLSEYLTINALLKNKSIISSISGNFSSFTHFIIAS